MGHDGPIKRMWVNLIRNVDVGLINNQSVEQSIESASLLASSQRLSGGL